jgi:hypothetical protein
MSAMEAENARLRELVQEAILQVEYLHEKFQPTGTGESFLVRANAILALDIQQVAAESDRLRTSLAEMLADLDDPEMVEISAATISRARQALTAGKSQS